MTRISVNALNNFGIILISEMTIIIGRVGGGFGGGASGGW